MSERNPVKISYRSLLTFLLLGALSTFLNDCFAVSQSSIPIYNQSALTRYTLIVWAIVHNETTHIDEQISFRHAVDDQCSPMVIHTQAHLKPLMSGGTRRYKGIVAVELSTQVAQLCLARAYEPVHGIIITPECNLVLTGPTDEV